LKFRLPEVRVVASKLNAESKIVENPELELELEEPLEPDEEPPGTNESPAKSRVLPESLNRVIAKSLGFELIVPLESGAGLRLILTLWPAASPVSVKKSNASSLDVNTLDAVLLTFPKTEWVPGGPSTSAGPDDDPEAEEADAVTSIIERNANVSPKSVVSAIVRADAGFTATKVRAVDPSNKALNLFID
jgi:hypothetical protein